jgi:hypothetical protein
MYSVLILFLYTALQMSCTLPSLNFGLSIINYGYVNITFRSILVLNIFIVLCSTFTTLFKYKTQFNLLVYSQNKILHLKYVYILLVLLCTYTSIIYLISYNPIINNIFIYKFNLNILNTVMSFFTLKTITLVLITLVIIYFNFFVILTLLVYKIYYTLNYTVVLLIISVRSLLTASQLLHLLIIYALLLVTFS